MKSANGREADLRTYLSALTPAARGVLLRELECGTMTGERTPGLNRVIEELRSQQRGATPSTERTEGPERRFFDALEPFLIDENTPRKLTGRIRRASLPKIWEWLAKVALPEETASYSSNLIAALIDEDHTRAARAATYFQKRAIEAMETVLQAGHDSGERIQLVAHLGGERVFEDFADAAGVFHAHRTLTGFANYLPMTIPSLNSEALKSIRSVLDQPKLSQPGVFPYALVLVLTRLQQPVHMIRLLTSAVDRKAGRSVHESRYAYAVDLLLGEADRAVARLESAMDANKVDDAMAAIESFHDLARGLDGLIDPMGDGSWSRWFNMARSDLAALLQWKIETLPGRMLRLLKPLAPDEQAPAATVDMTEVADIEAALRIFSACRAVTRDVSLEHVVVRLDEELESCLDTATPWLLMSALQADPGQRAYMLAQLDAAVRFAGRLSGKRYAELLARVAGGVTQMETRLRSV